MENNKELQVRVAELEHELATMRVIEQLGQKINNARDELELVHALAFPAVERGAARVTLSYVDLDEEGQPLWLQDVAAWQQGEVTRVTGRYYLPEFPIAQLWFANPQEPLLIADYTTDARVDPVSRGLCAQLGIRATASVPLTQGGRWIGFLMCGWVAPHEYSAQEIAIYARLPMMASPAVENRRLISNLEEQIAARTKKMRESEVLHRTTIDAIDDVIHVIDSEMNIILHNAAFAYWLQTLGITDNVIGSNLFELFPFLPDKLRDEYHQVFASGERIVVEDATEIAGRHRFTETRKIPVFDGDKVVRVITVLHDITERKQAENERVQLQQQVLTAQQQVIQELSTPIIPIMDRIIVIPLIGIIDTMRARDITRTLMAGINEHRAKMVILDITGVPIVDSGIAAHLDKTIQAARLKGARVIITGISDAVAEAIVDLGIDWSEIATMRDLQTGLIAALDSMGIKLHKE